MNIYKGFTLGYQHNDNDYSWIWEGIDFLSLADKLDESDVESIVNNASRHQQEIFFAKVNEVVSEAKYPIRIVGDSIYDKNEYYARLTDGVAQQVIEEEKNAQKQFMGVINDYKRKNDAIFSFANYSDYVMKGYTEDRFGGNKPTIDGFESFLESNIRVLSEKRDELYLSINGYYD